MNAGSKPLRHVAIIMDGNGRWARARGLPRIEGHRRGVETVREVLGYSNELGIEVLTLYAFSVENWNRPKGEVDALMRLLERFLDRELPSLVEKRTRLRVIGRFEELPESVRGRLRDAESRTAEFTDHTVGLALNYGARTEAVDACRAFARAVREGREDPDALDYERFSRYLYTAGMPDPDLVIRTSGESRLSNFLLLQSAYAEWFFCPVNWPEFSRAHFEEAVDCFHRRERRFGKTTEQLGAGAASALEESRR